MSGAHEPTLPVWAPRPGKPNDLTHHTLEWTSGTRGGGFVPADFGWHSNPKQNQEERGSSCLPLPAQKPGT